LLPDFISGKTYSITQTKQREVVQAADLDQGRQKAADSMRPEGKQANMQIQSDKAEALFLATKRREQTGSFLD
jgi:hypothetical protein